MANIALVHCPWFSEISIPLGLAYIASALRADGHRVTPYDLECWLQIEHLPLYYRYGQVMSREIDPSLVEHVKRPDLLIGALFARRDDEWPATVEPEERLVIERLRGALLPWVGRILEDRPDAVLLSMYSASAVPTLLVAREVRRLAPSVPLVVGGPAALSEVNRDLILRTGLVDLVIPGEGDRSVRAVFGSPGPHSPPGVARIVDGAIAYHPAPPLDVARLTTPDFGDFPYPGATFDHYRIRSHRYFPTVPISFSRGCVLRCAFCSEWPLWGAGARERPIGTVIDEMRELGGRYHTNNFFLCDSLLNTSKDRVDEVCDALLALQIEGQPSGARFHFAYFRPTELSPATIRKIARAGFRRVSFGVESGSEDTLGAMAKGTKPHAIARIIKDTIREGVAVQAPFIVGFPGETREEMTRSLHFFHELCEVLSAEERRLLQIIPTRFRLTAGSRLHREPARWRISLEPACPLLPTAWSEADRAEAGRLFVRYRDDVDGSERQFQATLAERFLDPLVQLPGSEPPAYVLEMGETIGRGMAPSDAFTLGDLVQVHEAQPLDAERAPFVLFFDLVRREQRRLEGDEAALFRRAVAGTRLDELITEFLQAHPIPLDDAARHVRSTLGCMIYQGLLGFDHRRSTVDGKQKEC